MRSTHTPSSPHRMPGKGLPLNGKDKERRNDWGYSIGGPILKQKLFGLLESGMEPRNQGTAGQRLRADGCRTSR